MATGPRETGEFCWVNMLTPHPEAARNFFCELLGWTYVELPGVGHLVQVGGRDIGGLFDLHAPRTPPGTKPQIGVMVRVSSADAAKEQVVALGGRARPAFDIDDRLRMTVCHDPTGAEFDVWESRQAHGTEVDGSALGAPGWFQGMTTDLDRAVDFYTRLFAWTAEIGTVPGSSYATFRREGVPVAGMLAITPRMCNVQPHWQTYFTVQDAEQAISLATERGAEVTMRVHLAPGEAGFAALKSPQGVAFGIIERAALPAGEQPIPG
jgi:predicted enzyme related to lactoylglutathione lyase